MMLSIFSCVCWLSVCLFCSLAHFLIGSFVFLVLRCMSCLYIFEINSLSVASFAVIFSHSEGCLFTLLIVSFVVQKLLILIRSHLFIFAFISNILIGKWGQGRDAREARAAELCKNGAGTPHVQPERSNLG